MMKAFCGGGLVAILVAAGLLIGVAQAAPTAQQRTKARAVDMALKKAATLTKGKKYPAAAESLKQAQKLLAELTAEGDDAVKLTAPLRKTLTTLHGDLELQGQTLPPLDPEPAAAAAPGKPGAAPAKGGAAVPAGNISFTKQVVPLLSSKCGGCHVRGSKGGFSALSYESLMKGTKDGPMVIANQTDSRLMQLIEQDDMPRSGPLPPEEKAIFRQWIAQGAKFDGANPAANITDPNLIAATNRMDNKTEVNVQMATGKETIHFTTDIGPVLVEQCYGCHGAGRRASANYDMDFFKGLLKGGDSGSAIKVGSPADSLLIKKLRGTASDGVRMPKDKPALSEDVIAKFEKWISEGAKFNGYDPLMALTTVVAIAHAEKISHDELAKERAERADQDWRTVGDKNTEHEDTENFIVFGNTGKDNLKEVAKVAEVQANKLRKVFKLPSSGPIVKGRTAIFVFDKKYDYDEVGTMLEKRELPREMRAHWRYDFIDANVYIVPAKNNEYSLSSLLGQQIAAVVAASQGNFPHWFVEGTARAVAAAADPKDARIRIWDEQIPSILSSGATADTIVKGSGEDADILSYGFVKFLRGKELGRYQGLVSAVHGHANFEAAFTKAYGVSPAQGAAQWIANARR